MAVTMSRALLAAATTMAYHVNLGDVALVTSFGGYENLDGLKLPKRLTTTIDRYPQFDIGVMKNTVNADASDLAAPEAVRSAAVPPSTAFFALL